MDLFGNLNLNQFGGFNCWGCFLDTDEMMQRIDSREGWINSKLLSLIFIMSKEISRTFFPALIGESVPGANSKIV